MLLLDRPCQHDDLARAARHQREPVLRRAHAGQRPQQPCAAARSRPATGRDAIHRRASRRRPVRRACPAPRLPATPRPARGRARTAPDGWRARPPCSRRARRDGTRPRPAPSTPATLRPPRAGGAAPRRGRSGAPRACSRTRDALSTSAVSAGIPASRAACSARASAARAAFVRSRRIAIPATTSSCAARDAGGKGAGSSWASTRSASSRRPISSRRRTSRWRACAAFTRSPCASSVAARRVERLRRPAQVARDQRDLGLGDDAARASHRLFRTEGARCAAQESLGASEIAELRHGDAAKRESRRVVAQGNSLQCAERVTRGKRPRRGGDQRVHRNPATLVTPAIRSPVLI